jgi:hypothetical protein
MFGFAAFLYAAGSWLQLVAAVGGSFEDAIRIPVTVAMIAGVIWWPIFIRRKLQERKAAAAPRTATHSAKSPR